MVNLTLPYLCSHIKSTRSTEVDKLEFVEHTCGKVLKAACNNDRVCDLQKNSLLSWLHVQQHAESV